MRARFVTDTATINVNSDNVSTSINVHPEQETGRVGVTSTLFSKNHDDLIGRDLSDQHPISAITDLQATLDGKQDVILDLSTIRSNAETAYNTIETYGDIVTHNANEFATANQGSLAATALQPNDNISSLTNDSGYVTSESLPTVNNNTITVQKNSTTVNTFTLNQATDTTINITVPTTTSELTNNSGFITGINSTDVTSALGYTPVNPSNLATVATSGDYDDLTNKPTIPDAQIQADWEQTNTSAKDYIKNKPTIPSGVIVDQVYDATSENAQSGVAIDGAGFITGIDSTDVTNALGYTPYDSSNPDGYITSAALPTVNDATLTIQKNSTDVGTFTANASSNTTINITVPTTASDVGALPTSTKYGASVSLSVNSSTYVVTAQLKDQDGNNLGSPQTIDLPLESVVVSGSYDDETKKVILTLQSGSTIEFSIADLVAGLQSEITSSNMLDADLVDDSTSTNKFVTSSEKTSISTALQPNDNISELTNDSGFITSADLPTNHVTTDTAQNISAKKTFLGEKAILFKQTAATDKLGFTLYTSADAELGALEYRPNTISGNPLLNLNSSQSGNVWLGFRYWSNINIIAPKPSNGNYYIPVNITNGTNTVTANNAGTVNINTLLPTKTSDLTNDSGYITGISSSDVTTALGYTPYNSSNPDGYTSNVGTVTSVNNTSPDANGNVAINIPAAQVNSDWNANSGVAEILNKPTLAAVATSGSYNDLTDKPIIPLQLTMTYTALTETLTWS